MLGVNKKDGAKSPVPTSKKGANTMNIYQFIINSRNAENVSFDLPDIEETLQVITSADSCIVLNIHEKTVYIAKEKTPREAIAAYIEWAFGMVNEWESNGFGEYEQTTIEKWASEFFTIEEQPRNDFDIILGR
jgi:hypothetical protein